MHAAIWNLRLRRAVDKAPLARSVFAAMNTCIDARAIVNKPRIQTILNEDEGRTERVIRRLGEDVLEIRDFDDFLVALFNSFSSGKALQVPTTSVELLDELNRIFEEGDERRIGGQSGIIASLLSRIGVEYALIYSPLMPPMQARVLDEPNIFIPVNNKGELSLQSPTAAAKADDHLKINWIFEYRKGYSLVLGDRTIIAPRANRFIVAARPPSLIPIFDDKTEEVLPRIGSHVDKVILSGYQYLRPTYPDGASYEDYVDRALRQIRLLKWPNTRVRIHMEFASMRNKLIRKAILTKLVPEVHSFGCNEVEIIDVLQTLGLHEEMNAVQKEECAWTLVNGASAIGHKLSLERVHVHNLGYHVMYLSKRYPTSPEAARTGILYSSNIGTSRSLLGDFFSADATSYEMQMGKKTAISYRGLSELTDFANRAMIEWSIRPEECTKLQAEGIIERNDHYLLVVPAQIATAPQATVGIGDCISSTAFVTDGTPQNTALRSIIETE